MEFFHLYIYIYNLIMFKCYFCFCFLLLGISIKLNIIMKLEYSTKIGWSYTGKNQVLRTKI